MLGYSWEYSERSNKSIHSRTRFWCDQCEYKNTTKTTFNRHLEQNMRKKYKFVNWEYKVTLQSALKMKQIYTYRSNVWMLQVWIQVYRENYSNQTYTTARREWIRTCISNISLMCYTIIVVRKWSNILVKMVRKWYDFNDFKVFFRYIRKIW